MADAEKKPAKRICIVTTVSITMKCFVVETAKYLHERCGYEITLICSPDEKFAASLPAYIRFLPVPMARGVDLSAIKSIAAFYNIFKRERFDLVQYATANASFSAGIAAWLARIPIRLYCQWGIRYSGMSGISRTFFRAIERFVCRRSTDIRSVSPMNRAFGIEEKLYKADKVKVIGNGGTIGVDTGIYDIGQKQQWREEIRQKYSIKEGEFVFGFSGRASVDKGCGELLTAVERIAGETESVKLLMVGPMEGQGGMEKGLLDWAVKSDQVISTGLVDNCDMCKYYAAMDVLVHPTYREGFGMVIQEAGALGVPVITTKIVGASEVMVDGESCLLVKPKDADELYCAMRTALHDRPLVSRLGQAAYKRTKERYDRPIMLENQRNDYEELLRNETI